MRERKAVTRELATRYRRAAKKDKGVIFTELCELTGWHRDHARRALRTAANRLPVPRGTPRVVPARRAHPVVYGEEVMVPLRLVWAVLDFPCGKRLAPAMAPMIEALERHGELEVGPQVRAGMLSSRLGHLPAPEHGTAPPSDQGPHRDLAREPAQGQYPDPHLLGLGRHRPGLRSGRPGRP
ncbi:MAG: hypothetical protein ACYCZM_01995 [Acidimicrobiales bacterium]